MWAATKPELAPMPCPCLLEQAVALFSHNLGTLCTMFRPFTLGSPIDLDTWSRQLKSKRAIQWLFRYMEVSPMAFHEPQGTGLAALLGWVDHL